MEDNYHTIGSFKEYIATLMTMRARKNPYQWIPSLYFFQALPFVVLSFISLLFLQNMGLSNSKTIILVSLLSLPWALKPILSPFLEKLYTKKLLTLFMQLGISFVFFSLIFLAQNKNLLILSILALFTLAVFSSIHDIVSDGLYIKSLTEAQQKTYVYLRTWFYQLGRLFIKGALLVVAIKLSTVFHFNLWQVFFSVLFILSFLIFLYNKASLPETEKTNATSNSLASKNIIREVFTVSKLFLPLLFIFLYNFSDAQMQKIIPLFLVDKQGLGLSLNSISILYGLIGSLCLMLGVALSSLFQTYVSLSKCLVLFSFTIMLSHGLFLIQSYIANGYFFIYFLIPLNQLLSGLANGAYMGYLLKTANKTKYPMSTYSLCTSVMALSFICFGAMSGFLQKYLSYSEFFQLILVANMFLVIFCYLVVSNDR